MPLGLAIVTVFAAQVICIQSVSGDQTSPPNVVLIMTDDQGWGDLSAHNNPAVKTPRLDGLRAAGAHFDRFYVSPVCAPTRASLLTGRYHLRTNTHGVTRGMENMRADEVTVAEAFRAAGYATGCFGKWHNGAHYPLDPNGQGFDEFFGFCSGHWNNYFGTHLQHNDRMVKTDGYITDVLTDAALKFIDGNKDQPFFCYVPYNAPHSPWQVPKKYLDRKRPGQLDDKARCAYAMCENLDDNIGRLLDRLDQHKLTDNTVVLFLTDNGPNSNRYNGDMRGRKGSVHEGGVRVPLLVRYPRKIRAGTRVAPIAAHIDLLPTLVELCEIKMPKTKPLDGRSLVPLLTGARVDWADRELFTLRRLGERGAVRTQRWRATREGKNWQLFDMQADPGQKTNVAKSNPGVVRRLSGAFEQLIDEVQPQRLKPLPIPVGHPRRRVVTLPGHEAFLEPATRQGISYRGRSGWANDYITNWSDSKAFPWWQLHVLEGGRFEVTLMYRCPADQVGSTLRVEVGEESVTGKITEPHDEPALESPDFVPRIEVFEYTWRPVVIGTLKLKPGPAKLAVKVAKLAGKTALELKAVRLRRVDDQSAGNTKPPGRRPNIILMMADDLGWADTGYNGHPKLKTPSLDAMARSGLRFNRFYAAAPVCSPTRGSCLTGRHPFRYGVVTANAGHMLPPELTLAELLVQQGYATGHFGKWHLGTLTTKVRDSNRGGPKGAAHFAPPRANGFQVNFSTEAKVPTWDPLLRPRDNNSRQWWDPVDDESEAVPYGTAYWSSGKRVTENTRGDDSRVIMDRVLPFVRDSVEADKPFFAIVWFHAPHLPVVAGPKHAAMYAGESKYARHYFGCITALDEQVGRLRGELQRLGVQENTLLCFCSDNGPEGKAGKAPGSAGPLRGRKRDLYEGGVRVPGLIEWPAIIRPGTRTDVPACTSDYLPTILAAIGVEPPDARPLDGVNLLPLLQGRMKSRPRPIGFESAGKLALIDNQYKIVRQGGARRKKGQAPGKLDPTAFQLYDIAADPGEQRDLAKQQPAIVARMAATLRTWRASCNRSRQGRDYGPR